MGQRHCASGRGQYGKTAHHVSERLKEKGIKATLVNVRFVKPLDHALFEKLAETHRRIVTLEENVVTGGFGQQVSAWFHEHHREAAVDIFAIPDQFVGHGSVEQQYRELGMDEESVLKRILKSLSGGI